MGELQMSKAIILTLMSLGKLPESKVAEISHAMMGPWLLTPVRAVLTIATINEQPRVSPTVRS